MEKTSGVWNHPNLLDVVIVVNNYKRFKSRYKLFSDFVKRMENEKRIRLHVGETVLGGRTPFIKSNDSRFHTVVHANATQELWHKENMINIVVSRLPKDWSHMAWIDADIQFLNVNWVNDCLHALEHDDVVQLWQTAIDLGPDGRVFATNQGFAWVHYNKLISTEEPQEKGTKTKAYPYAHPGYAWAITRSAYNKIGGLLDWAILGSGDHHMAMAFIGEIEKSHHGQVDPSYLEKLLIFQRRCKGISLGYVEGTVCHFWHGKKKDRRYRDRWQIFIKNNFRPDLLLRKDWQGLWFLEESEDTFALLKDISLYFAQRNEDSIDDDQDPIKVS